MSIWSLLQIVFDLILLGGVVAAWSRLSRPPQDDPRLSRGLQLLQTKITILEDLSDRTEAQVKQLSGLLDQKTRSVQNKILEAEQQILKIDHSMNKSMEVAEIFQDKIPHQEILERQRTVEYVKAARMAHSGLSVDEILEAVHLPREQVELIAKFNRERLMFDETQLPVWADRNGEEPQSFALNKLDFVGALDTRPTDMSHAQQIQRDFKHAVQSALEPKPATTSIMETRVADTLRSSMNSGLESMQPAVMSMKATAQTLRDRLVSTAEEMLRTSPAPTPARTESQTPATSVMPRHVLSTHGQEPPMVRKVIFPKIEK